VTKLGIRPVIDALGRRVWEIYCLTTGRGIIHCHTEAAALELTEGLRA
jgi:hypothetical protein